MSMGFREWLLAPLKFQFNEMRITMADISNDLNAVATKMRDNVFPAVQALLDRNAELEAIVAGQADEEVRESNAATDVVTAVNEVGDLLNGNPTVPDVPVVTEPEAPVNPDADV